MVKEYIARGKIRICVEYRKEAIFGDFWKCNAAKIENIAHLLIFTINYEYSSDSLGTSGVEKLPSLPPLLINL